MQVNGQLIALDLPNQVDYNCANEFDGSTHPHPESCDFYFFCAGGRSFLQKCGTDAKFDINQKRCVSKDFVPLVCSTDVIAQRSRKFIDKIGSILGTRNQV